MFHDEIKRLAQIHKEKGSYYLQIAEQANQILGTNGLKFEVLGSGFQDLEDHVKKITDLPQIETAPLSQLRKLAISNSSLFKLRDPSS